jgi:hypothetical protein
MRTAKETRCRRVGRLSVYDLGPTVHEFPRLSIKSVNPMVGVQAHAVWPNDGQVRLPSIVDDAVGPLSDSVRGSDDAAAPIAEEIAVGGDRHRRVRHQANRHHDIGSPGEMCFKHRDHGCRPRKVVDRFVADMNLHPYFPDSQVLRCGSGELRTPLTLPFPNSSVLDGRPSSIGSGDLTTTLISKIVRRKANPSPLKRYRLPRCQRDPRLGRCEPIKVLQVCRRVMHLEAGLLILDRVMLERVEPDRACVHVLADRSCDALPG